MNIDEYSDIFEPFENLIEVEILGTKYKVPENNSILRGFQYLNMDAISESDLCWNGECLDCQVWLKIGDKEKAVLSCRTTVADGMKIEKVSDNIPFDAPEKK